MLIKPLIVCTIQPPRQTKMIITPKQCRMIRANDKMYELLMTDPDLSFFAQSDSSLISESTKEKVIQPPA